MSGSEKVVLVTGASGGVGRGIALACAEAGWTVWVAARRAREGSAVAESVDAAGGRGRYVACDVRDAASVAAAVRAVLGRDGRLDGVVHNATSELSPHPVRLVDVPLPDLRDHIAVSVRGTWLLARSAFPPLRVARGSLLLLTSEAGFEGKARLAPYAAVKAMQRGLARALAREWGPHGVRVNGLAPLATSPAMERAFAEDDAMRARVLGRNPLGRLGDPVREIGAAARFLLSDDAAYVTGHTLMVDGGSCPVT
ncbi:MAG TPA: SDR family oxidoreductase [Myxococcota bacterium]|nr:SDR family oxidoreductase [Myxococcota bacterium]